MPDQNWLKLMKQHRTIAVIRSNDWTIALQMAKAVSEGGMHLIEITWNSDQPDRFLEAFREELPNCVVGAGTLLTHAQMQRAIAAGAQYLFTPHTDPLLIHTALAAGVPIIPGTLTPTEIVTAWQAGASSVKVFPVQAVGGASYIKSLQGPLGEIPLIPTGGVTVENASEFLAAGAIGVGLSGELFPKQALITRDWQTITDRAMTLMHHLEPWRTTLENATERTQPII
ncbi:MAG: bifunctional 4-hydroxy-2-oxoglutarate aldolase/2-dehydro-3-deoxy-phosphogluconate aldolase [Leptolyngbyaceae cyanobacterium bins.59]|nr:bifunctional 4-hydroxy-2-oxoglutarate aldolase/2-dehydro-3-deoxy-phosphogluconate aldolase [Leptolyngbyaceae cyanobacterium bins.59]